jgi:hypothetical protein
MQIHSPFPFLRRHALGVAVLCVLIAGYFTAVGWVGTRLRDDMGHTLQSAPATVDKR